MLDTALWTIGLLTVIAFTLLLIGVIVRKLLGFTLSRMRGANPCNRFFCLNTAAAHNAYAQRWLCHTHCEEEAHYLENEATRMHKHASYLRRSLRERGGITAPLP